MSQKKSVLGEESATSWCGHLSHLRHHRTLRTVWTNGQCPLLDASPAYCSLPPTKATHLLNKMLRSPWQGQETSIIPESHTPSVHWYSSQWITEEKKTKTFEHTLTLNRYTLLEKKHINYKMENWEPGIQLSQWSACHMSPKHDDRVQVTWSHGKGQVYCLCHVATGKAEGGESLGLMSHFV